MARPLKLDLNADLGESEPPTRRRALFRWITSANAACGAHAGNLSTMEDCVLLARTHQTRLGAHPGLPDLTSFGRAATPLTPGQFESLLVQQVAALDTVARHHKLPLRHIKLHGALYHMANSDVHLARTFLGAVQRWWPRLTVFAPPAGLLQESASRYGVSLWPEGFADRAYTNEGFLVPRDTPGAVLTTPTPILNRVRHLMRTGIIHSITGHPVPLPVRTLCIHGDSPAAVETARKLHALLLQ